MQNFTRRSFVSILGSIVTVLTGSKAFGATKPKPKKKKVVKKAKPVPKTTPPAAAFSPIKVNNKPVLLKDIPIGESLSAAYVDPANNAERNVVLHRTNAATVVAFSAICTHRGCTVEVTNSASFDCPCHGSSYNSQTGSVINGPATRALAPLIVKEQGGALLISSR